MLRLAWCQAIITLAYLGNFFKELLKKEEIWDRSHGEYPENLKEQFNLIWAMPVKMKHRFSVVQSKGF